MGRRETSLFDFMSTQIHSKFFENPPFLQSSFFKDVTRAKGVGVRERKDRGCGTQRVRLCTKQLVR
jgi:hypothetical protein